MATEDCLFVPMKCTDSTACVYSCSVQVTCATCQSRCLNCENLPQMLFFQKNTAYRIATTSIKLIKFKLGAALEQKVKQRVNQEVSSLEQESEPDSEDEHYINPTSENQSISMLHCYLS